VCQKQFPKKTVIQAIPALEETGKCFLPGSFRIGKVNRVNRSSAIRIMNERLTFRARPMPIPTPMSRVLDDGAASSTFWERGAGRSQRY